jgi:hypothetical protein
VSHAATPRRRNVSFALLSVKAAASVTGNIFF